VSHHYEIIECIMPRAILTRSNSSSLSVDEFEAKARGSLKWTRFLLTLLIRCYLLAAISYMRLRSHPMLYIRRASSPIIIFIMANIFQSSSEPQIMKFNGNIPIAT